MPYNPQRHNRRSIRLKGYDYTTPGAYYVTICAQNRKRLFGQIVSERLSLTPAGQITATAWQAIPRHFGHTILDAFVIMPDHIHGILVIQPSEPSPTTAQGARPRGTTPGSLAAIVQNFKAVSARRINKLEGTRGRRVWQEDYYEHIVRNEADMDRIRRYIAANPARWRS